MNALTQVRRSQLLDPDAAVALIPAEGATVAVTGSGGGILEPDVLLSAIEDRFLQTGTPRGMTLVHAFGIGDRGQRGMNAFAHEGMTTRVIGGHWTWSPRMVQLVAEEKLAAYSLPSGSISLLLREIGARRPGLITRTGLGTFVDPRQSGGRFNASAQDPLVELVEFDGLEYLRYLPFPVNVAIVRGAAMDPNGNIGLHGEAAHLDVMAVAQAARASGGVVLAQVKELLDEPLPPDRVHLPGLLVDAVVHAPAQKQTYASEADPSLYSAVLPEIQHEVVDPIRLRIAERAADEIRAGDVLNVGFGVSAHVVDVLAQRGTIDDISIAIEQGMIGGIPVSGDLFGASRGPRVMHASTTQFDLFAGGILDIAALGMAQVGADGSVNVSRIGGRIVGPGGFIDISQSARHIVFCGTFTTRGLRVDVRGDALRILEEGTIPKFVHSVDEVTFSGPLASAEGRTVTYVTERAVFRLTHEGLELTEVAQGIDIEREVLALMGFEPIVRDVRIMRRSGSGGTGERGK